MLHPLSNKIIQHIRYGEVKILSEELDKIIRDYLQERAEWLKNKYSIPSSESLLNVIDQAFQLSKDEEQSAPKEEKNVPLFKIVLPEKLNEFGGYSQSTLCRHINKIIDCIDCLAKKR